jgi:hypothetical protein
MYGTCVRVHEDIQLPNIKSFAYTHHCIRESVSLPTSEYPLECLDFKQVTAETENKITSKLP